MKWLIAVLLMFGAHRAMADPQVEEACSDVHRRSWFLIRCSYSTLTEHWTLRFKRGAYKMTVASGRHPILIEHLCSVAGTHVQEISGDREILIACGDDS